MPVVALIDGFLPATLHDALLRWAIGSESRFVPATVVRGGGEKVEPNFRDNLKCLDLGRLDQPLRETLLGALPALTANLGIDPIERASLEIELTAYGNGGRYRRHVDMAMESTSGRNSERLLSAVYYFHHQPRRYAGGELRLFRWGSREDESDPGNFRDVEPVDNRLAAFLSWAPHEVRPVRLDSDDFADRRFALNCWYRGEPRA